VSIKRLTKLVPPPESPTEVGSLEEWEAAEEELGAGLPRDYREFVYRYGSGLFAGLYIVYNPFAASEYIRLLDRVRTVCEIERDLKQSMGSKYVSFPIFPEKGGILPWGRDENGNDYYWLTEGPPSKWTVVQNNVRGKGYARHNCSMTGFLLEVLEGRIKPLASGYPGPEDFVFHPYPVKTV
jgi:hypothetical protein